MNAQPSYIEIMGERLPLVRPDFGTAEELVQQLNAADGRVKQTGGVARVTRTRAAVLGLCTQLGDRAGASWVKCDCNVLEYGGRVYSYLREHGATQEQILQASTPIIGWLIQWLFPRDKEIVEKERFFGAGGGSSTAKPSP